MIGSPFRGFVLRFVQKASEKRHTGILLFAKTVIGSESSITVASAITGGPRHVPPPLAKPVSDDTYHLLPTFREIMVNRAAASSSESQPTPGESSSSVNSAGDTC